MRKKRKWDREEDDPGAGLLNLFDIWLVFAVSLLVALLVRYRVPELANAQEATIVTNPGQPDMEVIHKQGQEIETLKMSDRKTGGEGIKLGTAYRLKSGKVVYVPEVKR